jgi:hypothetical protein
MTANDVPISLPTRTVIAGLLIKRFSDSKVKSGAAALRAQLDTVPKYEGKV